MMSTYSNQSKLPRLPIPKLEETLERFPRTVVALQTTEQRKETEKIIEYFLKTDGPKLQRLLEEYDREGTESGKVCSYVEEFWNEAYLAPDTNVVLNLNPFFLIEEGPDPNHSKNQIGRAASLTFAALKFASMLKSETLSPDMWRGTPLCMDQFKAILGSTRVPCHDKDIVEVDPDSSHVVVMKKNRMYYFKALWPGGTLAVNRDDLEDILIAIEQDVEGADPEELAKDALGVLTTLDRRTWSSVRRGLESTSEHNRKALAIVDSALFVLALDDVIPTTVHEAAANMLHGTYKLEQGGDRKDYQAGTCCNRWYDKLQLIVCGDGTAGVNFEHSSIDGHSALRFASDLYTETVVEFAQSITKTIYGKDRLPSVLEAPVRRVALATLDRTGKKRLDTRPKRLDFDLSANIRQNIFYAETSLGDHIITSETRCLEFNGFGKTLITANNLSPDSFVQMSMIVSYYLLYGELVCAYEPVLTKRFLHGRTEAMRSMTPKAAILCATWSSQFSTEEQKMDAMKAATKEHSARVKECAGGKGVERHLYALMCIAERNDLPLPDFFKSEPWKTVNRTVLSTSNCGNPSLRHFGFGPVVPDGFGIGYIIKDNGIHYACSSKCRQTQRYVHTLNRFLQEVGEYLSPKTQVEVSGYGDSPKQDSFRKSASNGRDVLYADGYEFYGEGAEPEPSTPPPPTPTLPVEKQRRESSRRLSFVRKGSHVSDDALDEVGVNVSPSISNKSLNNLSM